MTQRAEPAILPTLATLAEESGTAFILALFVDLTGKRCAKLTPVEAVSELQSDGVGFAGYAVGGMGQQPKDPDIMAIPDATSFTPVPFVKPGLAIVHCDPHSRAGPGSTLPASSSARCWRGPRRGTSTCRSVRRSSTSSCARTSRAT